MPFEEKFCPFCGQAAVIVFLTDQDTYRIDCQCCGKFTITEELWRELDVSHISDDDIRLFYLLPSYTRQTSENGTSVELDTHNWRECAQRHLSTPVAQKIRKCVEIIAKRAGSYGNDVDITPTLDYPLVNVSSAEALEALLTDLQTRGYLTYRASSGRLICSLTIVGWEYLEQSNTSANREKAQGRIRIPKPFLPPRRRRVACGVSEAAASACHDTMLGAKAPARVYMWMATTTVTKCPTSRSSTSKGLSLRA